MRSLRRTGPLGSTRSASERVDAAALFASDRRVVRAWLARLGVPRRDRDDLTQDVFVAACRSLPSYEPARGSLEAWLRGITTNLASHYRERAQHRREELAPDAGANAADATPGADEQLIAEDDRRLLAGLCAALPSREREVLVARDIDGLPMDEVAASLGLPVSTAYKCLYRARARLRVAYGRRHRYERAALLYLRLFARRGRPFEVRERVLTRIARSLARRSVRHASTPLVVDAPRCAPTPVRFPRFGRRRELSAAPSAAVFVCAGAARARSPRDPSPVFAYDPTRPPRAYPTSRRSGSTDVDH